MENTKPWGRVDGMALKGTGFGGQEKQRNE